MKRNNKKADLYQCYQEYLLLIYQEIDYILGNILTVKEVIRADEGVRKASENFQCHLVI